jgi:hypothetical protein
LALSQWGIFADELDSVAIVQLTHSYMHRKRWEANLQALAILKPLAEAKSGNSGKRIDADAMLNQIGIDFT